jgi:lipopolysaccharide export system permease protein
LLAPGQFRESPVSHRVFFVEKMSPDQSHVENVFVTSTESGKVSVVVSHNGHTETDKDGSRFVVLENGRRYDGEPGKPDFRIMEFQRYGVKITQQPVVSRPTPTGMSTLALLRHPTNANLAEFVWRTGLVLMAANLMLLGIPLAYQNPRRGRTINLVMAVLIFLTYSNLLNVVQSWMEQGRMSFAAGLLGLHAIVACVVVVVFWLRVRNRPLISRAMFGRTQGT